MKIGYIYKITHIPTGRYYIGQHKSPEFDEKYWGSGTVINNLYTKHPKEEFTREILAWASDIEELNNLEAKFVDVATIKKPKCLNLKTGGNVVEFSEEMKRKISNGMTEDGRKRLSEFSKTRTYSKETRAKISKANKGRKLSEEHKRKISEANKGRKPGFLGKHHSLETKEKMKKSSKLFWQNHEITEEERNRYKQIGAKGLLSQGKEIGICFH